MCQIKLNIIQFNNQNFNFGYLYGKKIIFFKLKRLSYYFELFDFVKVSKLSKLNTRIIIPSSNQHIFSSFNLFFQSFNILKRKILILKGLGLKAFLFKEKKLLSLKLGYSHVCDLYFDSELILNLLKKNFIQLKSFNKEKLGSFAFKIKNLKQPDNYQGKGIYYKAEKKKLKQVKKK
jgi:hypothetical protein